ncbi:Zinc finger, CCHC-type [Salix suchowensis]|nr:Zinc finger, CCHC-type [Salix suchowensis]
MHTIYSLTEAITLATKAETQLERARSTGVNRSPIEPTPASAYRGKFPTTPQSGTPNVTRGPSSSKPPMTNTRTVPPEAPRNPYSRPSLDKCYRCGQPGHRSNQCPKRGVVNLVEPGEGSDSETEVEGNEVDGPYDYGEITRGDEGELLSQALVIRRLLLTPKQNEPSQRHNIFRTRCTVNRKNQSWKQMKNASRDESPANGILHGGQHHADSPHMKDPYTFPLPFIS